MQLFLLESLSLTGWKRHNIVHFRQRDAEKMSSRMLADGCRAVRILRATVDATPISQQESDK